MPNKKLAKSNTQNIDSESKILQKSQPASSSNDNATKSINQNKNLAENRDFLKCTDSFQNIDDKKKRKKKKKKENKDLLDHPGKLVL
jgi:hypothetical protein